MTLKNANNQNLQKFYRLVLQAKEEPFYFFKEGIAHLIQNTNLKLSKYYPQYSFSLRKLWLPLTYKCNLQCLMCGQWGKQGRSKNFLQNQIQEELSLKELKNLIKEIKIFHPRVMFVGGEPLLYKNWLPLAKFIKQNKLRLEITTNGILLKQNAQNLFKYFDTLNISLDGPAKINDEIRGVKGSFNTVIAGIKEVLKLKKQNKIKKPYLNICFTINNKNYFALFKFAEKINQLNLNIDLLLFQHLEFAPQNIIKENKRIWEKEFNFSSNFWNAVCFDTKNINPKVLAEEIKKIKQTKFKNIKYILFDPNLKEKDLQNFYGEKERQIKKFAARCNAPWLEAFVYPEGNVWTCLGLPLGNIKEESFLKIWNGAKYKKLRNYLTNKNNFPICNYCANHWHNEWG